MKNLKKMSNLKEMIKEIEMHTGKEFDLSNRRHFFLLDNKIKRNNEEDLRVLNLVKRALKSNDGENDIFDSNTHYKRNRFND